MFVRSIVKVGLIFSLALPAVGGVMGCGGSNGEAKHPELKPGDMPAGGTWSGVYYSQLYGYLHVVSEGSTASGKWRNTAGDAWGELHGEVDGDLFTYHWTEHKIGMVGPTSKTSGKGYFRYTIPKEDESHVIVGEWGMDENIRGQKWEAVKQTNQEPDPDSVMPDEVEGTMSGGGWDGDRRGDEEAGGGEAGGGDEGGEAPPPPAADEAGGEQPELPPEDDF